MGFNSGFKGLKYDKTNGYFTWTQIYIYVHISRLIFFIMRNVSDQNCRVKSKQTLYFQKFFFRKLCRLWDNEEKYGTARLTTDDIKIRRMFFACWINKATDTHPKYVTLIAYPQQQWLHKRASFLHYTYIVCPVSRYKQFRVI